MTKTINYKGKQFELRGGAWEDEMNTNSQNTLEKNIIDDDNTGRYDIAWAHSPFGGTIEYYAVKYTVR